jgi:hypothetical protein
MAVTAGNVSKSGKVSQTRISGYLEGGPELAKALQSLDAKIKKTYVKVALTAGGRVIADEWSARAPIGVPPEDEHPGAYRDSLLQADAVKATGTATGGIGSVRPGLVSGIDDNDQPRVYAPVLEFRDGEPAARPAFDSARDRAVEAIGQSLSAQIGDGK